MAYTYEYPHMAVSTDVVLFAADETAPQTLFNTDVLLIRRRNDPYKDQWALPGGFVDMDETIVEAARRELREETGIDCAALAFVGYFDGIDRDPRERNVSFAFFGAVERDSADISPADDATEARWFLLHSLPPLAFDHARIIEAAVQCYRATW